MSRLLNRLYKFHKIPVLHRNYKPDCYDEPTMNELPVPCGPWHLWYKRKQRNYTRILIAGILTFVLSASAAKFTGCLFLNASPPLKPGPSSRPETAKDSMVHTGLPPCE